MTKEPVEILLVEDNEDDIALTVRAFRQNGLEGRLKIVRDGEQALSELSGRMRDGTNSLPKLVLLDLKLPKVDGFEVLEKMRSDQQLSSLPVVVLTSSREGKDILRCYRLGVNSYIVKPLEFQRFLDAVHVLTQYWLNLNLAP